MKKLMNRDLKIALGAFVVSVVGFLAWYPNATLLYPYALGGFTMIASFVIGVVFAVKAIVYKGQETKLIKRAATLAEKKAITKLNWKINGTSIAALVILALLPIWWQIVYLLGRDAPGGTAMGYLVLFLCGAYAIVGVAVILYIIATVFYVKKFMMTRRIVLSPPSRLNIPYALISAIAIIAFVIVSCFTWLIPILRLILLILQ